MGHRYLNSVGARGETILPMLCIVVPCYNEEEVLPQSSRVLAHVVASLVSAGKVSPESRVLLVDDGSHDAT